MIQFKLLDAYGITTPVNSSVGKLSMGVCIKVGIDGLPDEPKYNLPTTNAIFEWDEVGKDSAQIKTEMITWASKYVSDNYPPLNN